MDLIGQGVPTNSNILFRTPIPRGYLKRVPNGCVLMTLKRSWGPSRNVVLDYNRAQDEDNSHCLTMKSKPYQSLACDIQQNLLDFSVTAFRVVMCQLNGKLKGQKDACVYLFEIHFSLQLHWTTPEEYMYFKN